MQAGMNHIRRLLDEGKPTVATRIKSMWPTIAETAAAAGIFDYLEFLAEYAPYDQYGMENFVRSCELHGVGSMCKVDFQNRFYAAQKAMAAGFQAILFTDHHDAEQVRDTIAHVLPESPEYGGHFGFPNARWIGNTGFTGQESYQAVCASAVKAFMIEKKEAVDNIEAICKVPGVDMVQFGPFDYCMSRGWNIREHAADLREIEAHIIEVALENGVHPRCELFDAEGAGWYRELGVRHYNIGEEIIALKRYWSQEGAVVRKVADEA